MYFSAKKSTGPVARIDLGGGGRTQKSGHLGPQNLTPLTLLKKEEKRIGPFCG